MGSLSTLALIDTGLRGAAIALFLLIGLATLRQGRARQAAWLGALLSLGGAAYVVCSAPGQADHRSLWFIPVFVLCTGNVVVFWLFTRAVFDDRFKLRPWHAALWLAFAVWPVAWLLGADFVTRAPLQVTMRIAVLVLAALVVVQTIKDWRGDLVEGRRRLRVFIVVAILLHIAITASVDLSLGPEQVPLWLQVLNAAALATIAAVIAGVMLQANLDAVIASPVVAAKAPPASADEEFVDPALLSKLEHLMAVDRVYREEGLTIGTLASRLKLSERRLRQAINRGLGYRNFNDYLNRHRLADARQALADPAQTSVPILTIALDAGFQSLGPFNRAFKAETGMTPTEFRRASAKTTQEGSPNPESASR
jgi:AraC-like DNA-binding protein